MEAPDIKELVMAAMESRKSWSTGMDTDSYRLFHGVAEGAPGITVDRYASEVVVQVFRATIDEDWDSLAACILDTQEGVSAVRVVRRGKGRAVLATVGELADRTECHEDGCKFWNSLLDQRGNDPWFYLDFRSSRRFVAKVAKDARVANFFSYTGTAAVVAAKAGAAAVSNIDFGRWCLDVAKDNCELNGVQSRIVKDDFFSVARQWAGGQAKNRRRGGRARPGASYKPESFELVILDPPTRSNGPNGAVDILRDYPSLAKPCIQMVSEGGWLLSTHHHTGIGFDEWQGIMYRTAEKIGRTVAESQRIYPDKDFPIVGDEPLLKVLALKLA